MRTIARGLLVCALLTGCDEAGVRLDDPSVPVNTQDDAARLTLPPAGIARLYDVANPDGFQLEADPRVVWTDGDRAVSLGPLSQLLPVFGRTAAIDQGEILLTTSFRDLNVPVPVRVQAGADLRICRYQVRATDLTLTARLRVTQNSGRDLVEVVGEPVVGVEPEDLFVNPIGPCALPDALRNVEEPGFDFALVQFVTDALETSATQGFEASLLETAGIATGRIELDRKSPFPNRRGTIALQNDLNASEGLRITDDRLEVRLDLGVAARRAGCAPPVELAAPGIAQTRPIEIDDIDLNNADFAMAISSESLARISQGMILSGFACRGLEDARPPQSSEDLIPTEDIRLRDIGIDLDLGPWMRITSSPGALPTLRTRPWAGDIQLTWESLSIEFYGDFLGAPVRLGQLVSNARASLRPRRNTQGFLRFDVDAIDISRATFESPWLATPPDQTTLDQWAQRALLLILGEQFVLPLPFQATSVRVTGSAIRDDDLVLFLVF